MDFINAAHYESDGSNTVLISKPTNTADNDIMFAVIQRAVNETITPPVGWTLEATDWDVTNSSEARLYRKVASGEGANYSWSWATVGRCRGTIVTYRGGFNTTTPIDVVSNTAYVISNTTVRAASMSVAAANSGLLCFATIHYNGAASFTKPSVPTTDWVENVDTGSVDPRKWIEVCSMVWTGSGATGNMDATASVTPIAKHAFAVALNPAAAGGLSIPVAMADYRQMRS